MPIPYTYQARSAIEILKHFVSDNPVGHFVNVVMAQPFGRVSPFCLLIFSSDSKYTAENVASRWDFIVEELRKEGIGVISISSDSDPRYNSAMKCNSSLGTKSDVFLNKPWFSCGNLMKCPFYVQDLIHIATKLRNLLLKTLYSALLFPFGPGTYIQSDHLKYIINNFTKDQHMLTDSVLNPEDRQNYSSVVRMCNEKVINLLKTSVQNGIGTATFLEIIRDTVDSYLDTKLEPLQRIRKSWYSLFITRLWREYVRSSPRLTLDKNFMSSNCYNCIELNAHSLVKIMLHLKEKDLPHLFMPHLLDSQVCEETFRQIRSFTTVYSTVANCTVKEIIGRLDKIQLQNDISLNVNFLFPRSKSRPSTNIPTPSLPSKEEICLEIERCKADAIAFANQIGLIRKKSSNTLNCAVAPHKTSDWQYLPDEKIDPPLPSFGHIELRDYSRKVGNMVLSETSQYVELYSLKKRMVVKKTSLCWFLRTDTYKLSSDRLQRVKTKFISKKKSSRRNISKNVTAAKQIMNKLKKLKNT